MKKALCLILAFMMSISLCACGTDARYEALIACLDAHDYEGAYAQVAMLREEAIANGDIVVTEPQEEDYDLVSRYYNVAYQLSEYQPDNYFSIWDNHTDTAYAGNDALAFCYAELQDMADVDQWLGSEYFSYLEEDGVPTDRLALLDRFTVLENKLLKASATTVDNMGNENTYGEFLECFYDEAGTLVTENVSWEAASKRWDNLFSTSGYYRYTYDQAGHIVETKITDIQNSNTYALITPAYDGAGNLISETITDNYGTYTFQHTYDASGKLIQTDFADDWSDYSIYYTYDANGNLIQKDCCQNGYVNWYGEDVLYVSAQKTTVNTYDGSGKLVSTVVTDIDYDWNIEDNEIVTKEWSKKVDTVSYTYDAEGRLLQEAWAYGNRDYPNSDSESDAPDYKSRVIDYVYGDFYIFN